MSLTQSQMDLLRKEIAPLIKGQSVVGFFESTPKHFVMTLGERHLLLCLQAPFLRFHLLQHIPKAEGGTFARKIGLTLMGLKLDNFELLNEDRILRMAFRDRQHAYFLVAEFFPKRPNLYLLDSQMQILEALYPSQSNNYQIPPKPAIVREAEAASLSSATVEKTYRDQEQEALFQQEKRLLESAFIRQRKRTLKVLENGRQSLKTCLEWEKMSHEALLLQSHLYQLKKGMTEAVIRDWENDNKEIHISLDPLIEPYEEVEKRFRKSKKLRAGIEHAHRMIEKAESELQRQTKHLEQLAVLKTLKELHNFQKQLGIFSKPAGQAKKPIEKALPFREFCSAAGLTIWVGKSAKDNDAMTFSYAKGSDWWLHVRDFSGSHVIVRSAKNQEPDQESLKDAIQLALHYSKAKEQGDADVCITQCKFVVRFGKGKAGKVHISKHQVVHAKVDPERLRRLKERA